MGSPSAAWSRAGSGSGDQKESRFSRKPGVGLRAADDRERHDGRAGLEREPDEAVTAVPAQPVEVARGARLAHAAGRDEELLAAAQHREAALLARIDEPEVRASARGSPGSAFSIRDSAATIRSGVRAPPRSCQPFQAMW